jgi:hypothetical protein
MHMELELPFGPLEAGPDFWRTLGLWQLVEPDMLKSWLGQEVESGRWSLLGCRGVRSQLAIEQQTRPGAFGPRRHGRYGDLLRPR